MKDAAQTVGAIASFITVVIGAAWTYVLFRWRRLRYPRLNVQHKIHHWPANGRYMLHVAVETKSVGEVILRLESMLVRVQQLMPLPPEVVDAIAADRDPVPENESEVLWPEIACRRCDWKTEPREIEPGEVEEHHFDFVLPDHVEKIEVYSHIVNARKARRSLLSKAREPIGWNTTSVYSLEPSKRLNVQPESERQVSDGARTAKEDAAVGTAATVEAMPRMSEVHMAESVTKQGPPKVQPPRAQPAGNAGSSSNSGSSGKR